MLSKNWNLIIHVNLYVCTCIQVYLLHIVRVYFESLISLSWYIIATTVEYFFMDFHELFL